MTATYLYGDLELELSDVDVVILLMIANDKQQRDIADELRISICNAGRKKGRLLDRLSRETGLPERRWERISATPRYSNCDQR